jgi:hypothetical protein
LPRSNVTTAAAPILFAIATSDKPLHQGRIDANRQRLKSIWKVAKDGRVAKDGKQSQNQS